MGNEPKGRLHFFDNPAYMKYLAELPGRSHRIIYNEQGEAIEVTQVNGQPPTVAHDAPEE